MFAQPTSTAPYGAPAGTPSSFSHEIAETLNARPPAPSQRIMFPIAFVTLSRAEKAGRRYQWEGCTTSPTAHFAVG